MLDNVTDGLLLNRYANEVFLRTRVWAIPSAQRFEGLDAQQLRTVLDNVIQRFDVRRETSDNEVSTLGIAFTQMLSSESAKLKYLADDEVVIDQSFSTMESWLEQTRQEYKQASHVIDQHNSLMGFKLSATLGLMASTPKRKSAFGFVRILRLLKTVEKNIVTAQLALAQAHYARMQFGISSKAVYAEAQRGYLKQLDKICTALEPVIFAMPVRLLQVNDAQDNYANRLAKHSQHNSGDAFDRLTAIFETLESCFCDYNYAVSVRLAKIAGQVERAIILS